MSVWEQGLAEPLLRFIKNPSDLSSTQEMYHLFSKESSFQEGAALKLMKDAGFKKLYDAWYSPEAINLDRLLSLPKNTFGYIYAEHMKKNGLDPNFISEFGDKNLLSYLWMRAKHVHDIGHVLTGFDTSLVGEISIKGFEVAQYASPSSAATSAAGLLSLTILMPDKVDNIFSSFMKGYELGKKFPLLMAISWDKEWETPWDELLRKYQIPVTSM